MSLASGGLVDWWHEYQANVWDKEIEDDLDAGRLDAVLASKRDL
jgi:hypothetical protein